MQTVIPELGQLALIIALGVALVQGVLPLIGAQRAFPAWIALARPAAWAGGLLQGDMGISHAYSNPVWPLIAERLALTIPLAVFAMLITSMRIQLSRNNVCG